MDIGDNKLKTTLASIGFKQALGMEMGTQAMSVFAGTQSTDAQEGRVLQLLNMVTAEELIDNDEYEGKHNPILVSITLLIRYRNLRRHSRRVREVWTNSRDEDTKTGRRQSAVKWCGQDFLEVC